MFLDNVSITREEEHGLRKILRRFYMHEGSLTDSKVFSEQTLLKLLALEARDRKRVTVIERLHARYTRLRKLNEAADITARLERRGTNERAGD